MKTGRLPLASAGAGKNLSAALRGKIRAPSQIESTQLITLSNTKRFADLESYALTLIGKYPNSGFVWKLLGESLYFQGKDALHALRKTAELLPNDADVHNNLGLILADIGLLNDAVVSFNLALKIKPDYARVYYNKGNALRDLGQLDDAAVNYLRALELKPDYARAHFYLGYLLKRQGKLAASVASLKTYLEIEPSDRLGASLLLAAMGVESIPSRASEAHLEDFYNKKAVHWDKHLDQSQKTYYGAELVAQSLKLFSAETPKLDILDAGCGTGHVGLLVRNLANKLDGVDMSLSMLNIAREKKIYDELCLGDLEVFMKSRPNSYDAITCAATLIHFGDLSKVFSAASAGLRKAGLFVFTVFKNENEQDGEGVAVSTLAGLDLSGCYSHSRSYIIRIAQAAGFVVEALSTEIHEMHSNGERLCYLVVLRRM